MSGRVMSRGKAEVPSDIRKRRAELAAVTPRVNLYTLVDGLHWQEQLGSCLTGQPGIVALFSGTKDAHLAHAGPWLMDCGTAQAELVTQATELEFMRPAVSWLMSHLDMRGLAQVLQLNIDVRLPGGREAMLRFWDPRVLALLAEVFEDEQRESLFGHVLQWHFMRDGQRVWVGRDAC